MQSRHLGGACSLQDIFLFKGCSTASNHNAMSIMPPHAVFTKLAQTSAWRHPTFSHGLYGMPNHTAAGAGCRKCKGKVLKHHVGSPFGQTGTSGKVAFSSKRPRDRRPSHS
eukprot:5324227-Amphidinium_carterae.1